MSVSKFQFVAFYRSLNRDKTIYVSRIHPMAPCINKLAIQGDDADAFNPDRFMDEKGQLRPALRDTKDGELLVSFSFSVNWSC